MSQQTTVRDPAREPVPVWRTAGPALWLRALGYSAAAIAVLGIPTVLIPNEAFSRMLAPTWWSYPLWIATAVLIGLVLAVRRLPEAACPVEGRAAAGGTLGLLAIACPTCNAVVVSTMGVSGALSVFAPLQPAIGVAGIAVLVATLVRMLRVVRSDGTGGTAGPSRITPREAWAEAQQHGTRILDLRTSAERRRYGAPPGAIPVSPLRHAVRPEPDAIYLCQHAVRSKLPAKRGAREVAGGFAAWRDAGLPVTHPRRTPPQT